MAAQNLDQKPLFFTSFLIRKIPAILGQKNGLKLEFFGNRLCTEKFARKTECLNREIRGAKSEIRGAKPEIRGAKPEILRENQ